MAESSTLKAKKVLNYLFSLFSKLSVLPAKYFFKIFDAKIYPVMLYGAELWGLQYMHCVEQLQIYACKRLLSVRTNSCNLSILGDTGRFPVQIISSKRCIKYWLRILKMPRTRYVKLCYEMLLHLDNLGYSNWVTAVRLNLSSNGYGYIWENQHVDNEKNFLYHYTQRLKDQYIQKWRAGCIDSIKLSNYYGYKEFFCCESYIELINIDKFRSCLANFRSGSHSLMSEKGRYDDVPREFRFCVYCDGIVEDEIHFLLICPLYSNLREVYIDDRFTSNANTWSFLRIMSCRNEIVIRNLAMFLYYAFKTRSEYIKTHEL